MEILVFLLFVFAIAIVILLKVGKFLFGKKTKQAVNNDPQIKITIESGIPSQERKSPRRPLIQTEDGAWVVNPGSEFPLSIKGVDKSIAESIKISLENNFNKGMYEAAKNLMPIFLRHNPRCNELDSYIREFKPKYLKKIEELKSASAEWSSALDKDKEDMMTQFREEAIQSLDIRPFCDLETLFEWEPKDASFDDVLIEKYGYENLNIYLRYSGKPDAVRIVPASHRDREIFEKLTEMGLAIRGTDIPLSSILSTLKIIDLNKIAGKEDAPFKRKNQAVEYLMGVPDIKDRLGKVVAFREIFQLRPLPNEFSAIDLGEVSNAWRYSSEVTSLIAHTFTMSAYSDNGQANYQDNSYCKGWELQATNQSCPYCLRAASKTYAKNKRPKTPLHLGCRCCVLTKFD